MTLQFQKIIKNIKYNLCNNYFAIFIYLVITRFLQVMILVKAMNLESLMECAEDER